MDFEWDEAKREANILKHGIDFVDVMAMFAHRFRGAEDRRRDYGERRYRIISARKARRNERRAYYAGNAGPGPQDERAD
jgi:uncharacterized protein